MVPILLGIVAGILAFLPLFGAMRLSRRVTEMKASTVGLYALAGACISLLILIVCTVVCGITARGSIVPFTVAEGVAFLGFTIAYVMYKNALLRKRPN